MFGRRLLAVIAVALVAGCTTQPTGVATNPPVTGGDTTTDSPGGSATAGTQTSGVRTVLSPLGLNVRSDSSTSATKLGAAAQGAQLKVLEHTDQNGGWYRIQGATLTGWITADPTLSAAGTFVSYSSTDRGFGVLYPSSWTFAEETGDVAFRPQSGPDSLVVRTAAAGGFGAAGAPGYANSGDTQVIVCGVTGDLLTYEKGSGASATPLSAAAPLQPHLAQIRLKLDATHSMSLDFNYTDPNDLDTFGAFYNSMTFPFPACQKATPPSPSPS